MLKSKRVLPGRNRALIMSYVPHGSLNERVASDNDDAGVKACHSDMILQDPNRPSDSPIHLFQKNYKRNVKEL